MNCTDEKLANCEPQTIQNEQKISLLKHFLFDMSFQTYASSSRFERPLFTPLGKSFWARKSTT